MDSEPAPPSEARPERALALLASLLILGAAGRVALPLLVFLVLVALLAAPMSGLIAWLSRLDDRSAARDEPEDPQWLEADVEAQPFVRVRVEPMPRPQRPRDDN